MTTGLPTTPTTPAEPSDPAPGQELGGRYRLLEPLGSGSSATVWLAEDTSLRRRVAVKVLHPSLAQDVGFLERFRAEAQSAAAMSNPNIMSVYDWGEADVPFLVMEYLSGGSLRSMLDSGVTLSASQVIAVGLDACRGLHYAHRQDLVHRDIKPANLLFGEEGRLRLGDFGLARALADAGHTEPGDLVGTARYASPEQAQGENLTAQSDVYSLGLVLIEAFTGDPVFTADTVLATLSARVDTEVPLPDLPAKLADALCAMTAQDSSHRATATQAGVALMEAAQGLPRPQPLPIVPPPAISTPPTETERTVQTSADATQVAGTPTLSAADDGPVRRWPWVLLTLIAVTIAGWFAWNQVESNAPNDQVIPDVANLTVDEALMQLGDAWMLDEKFDRVAGTAQGLVIRTDPPAGESLVEGGTLSYWVSLGQPLIRVPVDQLVGRSEEQALATLEAIGLVTGEITAMNDEEVPEGLVLAVVSRTTEVPEGDAVDLVVSLGPVTRQIPEFTPATVADDYVAALAEIDLESSVSEEYDDEVPVGGFVRVDPVPGSEIAKFGLVSVVVSLGPEPVPVPNTTGELIGPAIELLEDAGFIPVGEGNFRCPAVGTDPPAGTLIQPGNPVTVILSDCE